MIKRINQAQQPIHVNQANKEIYTDDSELVIQHLSRSLQVPFEQVDRILSSTQLFKPSNVNFLQIIEAKLVELRKSGEASPKLLKTLEQIKEVLNGFVDDSVYSLDSVLKDKVIPFLKKVIRNFALNKKMSGKEFGLDLSAEEKLQLIEVLENFSFEDSNGSCVKLSADPKIKEYLEAYASFKQVAESDPTLANIIDIFEATSNTLEAKLKALADAVFDSYVTALGAKDETACDALKALIEKMSLDITRAPLAKIEGFLREIMKKIQGRPGYFAVKTFLKNICGVINHYLSDSPVSPANINKAIEKLTAFFKEKSSTNWISGDARNQMIEWFGGNEGAPDALIDILEAWKSLIIPDSGKKPEIPPFDYMAELEKAIAKAKNEGKSNAVIDQLEDLKKQITDMYTKHTGQIDSVFFYKKIKPLLEATASNLLHESTKLSSQDRLDVLTILVNTKIIGNRGDEISLGIEETLSVIKLEIMLEGSSGKIIDKLKQLCNKKAGSLNEKMNQFAEGLFNIYVSLSKDQRSGKLGTMIKEAVLQIQERTEMAFIKKMEGLVNQFNGKAFKLKNPLLIKLDGHWVSFTITNDIQNLGVNIVNQLHSFLNEIKKSKGSAKALFEKFIKNVTNNIHNVIQNNRLIPSYIKNSFINYYIDKLFGKAKNPVNKLIEAFNDLMVK